MAHHDFEGSDEASRLAREGKIHEALACYDRALVSNPKNDVILTNKAIALISLGRYEESLDCSKKAITINPYGAGVWINKGIALEKLGRLPEAAEALEQAVAISPYNAYTRALLGIVYQKLELYEKAEAQNRKLQEIVFPHEYAGFYFATATFLLGILLGGIMSVEGKPQVVTIGSALIIILFFVIICSLYIRARKMQMEVRRDVVTGPCDATGSAGWNTAGISVTLGFLVFVFVIGTVSGIAVWQYFR
ncbi:MAG: tetratricopeptide repeat protein [Methanoregula sp.]|jgi:tetratricopeptide (TPR) repeat protein